MKVLYSYVKTHKLLVGRVERKNTSLKKNNCSTTTINWKQPIIKDITIIDEISNPKSNLEKTLV
jgi:hypothetical protein